jgi:LytS/YehU family sensor histidine kinase
VASNLELHAAKIAANVIGVAMFMGLLNLVRELELARKEAQTSRDLVRSARLEALQYQVRPHFLFNLLNTLAYLIRTQPTKARELTLDLAEFLRYTLAHESDRTTLAEEFEQIERYVELERARFGDGLVFRIDPPPDDLAHQVIVPPLILQPLVENAIRHGSRDGQVDVCVDVDRVGDHLRVRVLDDGPGPDESVLGSGLRRRTADGGVGLTNVQERLERFYREGTELTLKRRDEGGACVEFEIPVSMSSPHPHTLREQAREQLRKVIT